LFDDLHLARRGYVNKKALLEAFDRARHGIEFNISGLLQALALEVWLRSLEHRRVGFRSLSNAVANVSEQAWSGSPVRVAGAA